MAMSSPGAWDDVDLDAAVLPAYVRGRVRGLGGSVEAVVVALNGRVSAVSEVPGPAHADFEMGALLPPGSCAAATTT